MYAAAGTNDLPLTTNDRAKKVGVHELAAVCSRRIISVIDPTRVTLGQLQQQGNAEARFFADLSPLETRIQNFF